MNQIFSARYISMSGDIFVKGKTGLDAFPGSELEQKLVENDIHTLAVGEFSSTY